MARVPKNLRMGILAAWACSSCLLPTQKEGGVPTPPDAATVNTFARKLAFNARTQLQLRQSAAGACGTENIERCGCLPKGQWFTTELFVYDVVCCNQPGDTYVLYSCGEATCEETDESVSCR